MFLVHPSEFLRRRKRCEPVVKELLALERETVAACNVCRSTRAVIIARRDRYGFPVRTALCTNCGLVYLADRFTSSSYGKFYGGGGYRRLSSLYNGTRNSVECVQEVHLAYSTDLIDAVKGYVSGRDGGALLDIGGGTGLVAQRVARYFDLRPTVLEPSAKDVKEAKRLGVEAFEGSLEGWETAARFDLILLCKTIEHLFDLRSALRKIRELLKPNGLFYCDIVDFLEACRHEGPPEVTSKIDHCYWLCQETAPSIFRANGFEVVSMNTVCGPNYVGFLLRRIDQTPPPEMDRPWIEAQLRRLREMEAEWHDSVAVPYDAVDWLKRRGYRAKRAVARLLGK